jgi:hypothetical protein
MYVLYVLLIYTRTCSYNLVDVLHLLHVGGFVVSSDVTVKALLEC